VNCRFDNTYVEPQEGNLGEGRVLGEGTSIAPRKGPEECLRNKGNEKSVKGDVTGRERGIVGKLWGI